MDQSIGCASAMGLGVAQNTPRPIVVLDGDALLGRAPLNPSVAPAERWRCTPR